MANPPSVHNEGNLMNKTREKEALNVLLTNPQVLDCDGCLKPLTIPVSQCEHGHISCSNCCIKPNNMCPISGCLSSSANTRCWGVEKILISITIPCTNEKVGCKMRMTYGARYSHEQSCLYAHCPCPVRNCHFISSFKHLRSHLRQKHEIPENCFSFNYRFSVFLNWKDKYGILEETDFGILFLIHRKFEAFGQKITLTLVGPSMSGRKFCFEMKAKGDETTVCFQSVIWDTRARIDDTPSKGSLLIPRNFCGTSSVLSLEIRIW